MEPNPNISDSSTLLQKAKTRVLLLFDELPEWAQDNEHIHSGWRPQTNSYWECLKSMAYVHNESGNIYTHFFAAVWMVVLGSWWSGYANEWYPATGADDAVIFSLFFAGGIICFLLSTAYHLFSNHSHTTHLFCLKLDFMGILTVIAGCFPPGVWYVFPCAERTVKIMWIALNLTLLSLASLLALFSQTFQAPKMRALRGLIFPVLASSAFYPIIIKIFQIGWARADAEYGASLYGAAVVVYLSSVMVYALRVTEAWRPGGFDIWGQSHQIFHVGMVVGLMLHFAAFWRGVDYFYGVEGGRCLG
ncbi:hypothetical protein CJF32_00006422 [Rutstroemia sp. NJR-2017a WRK4]|nr:hypothetical protein CJF32_00006422 [Rutstroemia sp. NJR-2017a WRK4]